MAGKPRRAAPPPPDHLAVAAAAIIGARSAPWLPTILAKEAKWIRTIHKARPPPRAKMRAALSNAAESADRLARLLTEELAGEVAVFIVNAAPPRDPASAVFDLGRIEELVGTLGEVARRARIAGGAIPRTGGRTAARAMHAGRDRDAGFTAELMCALVVVEAWRAVRGRQPGRNNADATDAVASLWAASTGEASTAGQWRRPILEALAIEAVSGRGYREAKRLLLRHLMAQAGGTESTGKGVDSVS